VSIVLIPASVESHHADKNKRSKWIETGIVVVYYYSLSLTVSLARALLPASYPGLLAPAFVACSTNMGEGLVKLSHVV